MGNPRRSGWLHFGLPGLLAGLLLPSVLGGWRTTSAQIQGGAGPAPVSRSEAGGTFAFTSAGPGTSQLLYLVDPVAQSFAVYRVDPGGQKGIVKLEAARHYRWDLKLAEYNNQPPEVGAIESMVRTTTPGAK